MNSKWKGRSGVGASTTSLVNVERKLVTHVPDLVVFDKNPGKIPHVIRFDGVLLFADVSGFTALTEKYTMYSNKGTDALTVTLNAYIGKIVQNILQAGGDILKFAGDAILAVWKVTQRKYLEYAISQAAKCSLTIQEKCDNQITDVGVKLRVKIAISAGKIYATFVGNEACRYFVMAGRPVGEVNAAEKYCAAGLVVLSPNALELSERDNIIFDPLSERFGLVRYLRHDPRKDWHEYVDVPDVKSRVTSDGKSVIRIGLRLRPNDEREMTLRKYVSNVVQRKVDDDQPLKFLSEMRQCSIAFINMSFHLNERDRNFHEKQCANMQQAFDIVYNCTVDMQGSLNKIFMFDKGCTFLVIFGLPGDKHEQEPAHALQASWRITQDLHRLIPTINVASIGVTTGPVFCGVIGHGERHEYTVIGQKVNLAARLMMHYPNVVSCDIETFQDSKLSKDMFSRLPVKAMKGCGEVIVHQYEEGERKPVGRTIIMEPEYPIIGREVEVNIFVDELRNLKQNQSLGAERRVIVFEGEAGFGKSRIIEEIEWRAALEEVKVIGFPLAINDANSPYFTVKTLVELLLGIQEYKDVSVREKALLSATNPEDADVLCVFNRIINVDFPESAKVAAMSSAEKTRNLQRLLVQIVHKVSQGSRFVLFTLDDAQNVDSDSWKFISTLAKDSRALCVLGMRPFSPDKPPCLTARQVLDHPKTMYVRLTGLNNDMIGPLVCQLLKVQRIPAELERLIIARSHGVPRWCEQLVHEMQNAGLILLVPLGRSRTTARQTVGGEYHELIMRKTNREKIRQSCVPFHLQFSVTDTTINKDNSDTLVMDSMGSTQQEENSDERRDISNAISSVDNNLESAHLALEKGQDDDNATSKKMLPSWTDRLSWRKSGSRVMEFLKNPSKSNINMEEDNSEEQQFKKINSMECVIKPGYDINTFPVPASIIGMALARLDRMKPFEQLIVKSAAVIGENFSRQMLRAVVPGYQEDKFERSIFQLMRSRVFQCAFAVKTTVTSESATTKITRKNDTAHRITCFCHIDEADTEEKSIEASSSNEQERVAAGCTQLMFINSLVQETSYKLWLEDQRKDLHESCAKYLETIINEVLTTGETNNAITNQFRLSSKFSSANLQKLQSTASVYADNSSTAMKKSSWKSTGTPSGLFPSKVMSSVSSLFNKKRSSGISVHSKMTEEQPFNGTGGLGVPDFNKQRRVSSSVIGRMNVERLGASKTEKRPLTLQYDSLPEDYVSHDNVSDMAEFMAQAKALNVEIAKQEHIDEITIDTGLPRNEAEESRPGSQRGRRGNPLVTDTCEITGRRMSYGPLWSQSVGLSSSYERLLTATENEAKRLTNFQLNKVMHTPYEMHDVFALLNPQLAFHWRKAGNTEKTILYLLKAGESLIATLNLNSALDFLEEADEIVLNLAKGNDIVAKVNEDEDSVGIEDVKVLSVSRDTKARVQSLLGQILYQQGKVDQALPHFLKALKIRRCSVPTSSCMISLRFWHENRIQQLHRKNPAKYIGTADSKLANKYIEQARCLSYVWQILLNLRRAKNRIKLSKLVAVMQVNRSEAADDDLQELITSYTYMMQQHQLVGDLSESTVYESKATQRCSELPSKLTASDLYITGHLHLVSCSIRTCHGKLAYATTSGYRAYNVADSLQDTSIKLIVLPLLAQIHMMTGRGRACNEVLTLLHYIADQENDDAAMAAYYCSCMDLLLDCGYRHEEASACLEYLQNSESHNIGDVPHFCIRSTMAVWCFRQHEKLHGNAWLKLSEKIMPDFFDNFLSVRAYTRLLEAHLIAFRMCIETHGSKSKETAKAEKKCRHHLLQMNRLCKQFPVFHPRYLHLKSYYWMLIGQNAKAREKVTQAASLARYCGNSIDRKWALHSQLLWFSFASLSSDDVNYWVNSCLQFLEWSAVFKNDHINRQFSLKLPAGLY